MDVNYATCKMFFKTGEWSFSIVRGMQMESLWSFSIVRGMQMESLWSFSIVRGMQMESLWSFNIVRGMQMGSLWSFSIVRGMQIESLWSFSIVRGMQMGSLCSGIRFEGVRTILRFCQRKMEETILFVDPSAYKFYYNWLGLYNLWTAGNISFVLV